jgi:hypothetical protein
MSQFDSLRGADLRSEEDLLMVEGWSMERKIGLMNRVFGSESGLVVALIYPGSIYCQIDQMTREQLTEVIRAVSIRLAQLP